MSSGLHNASLTTSLRLAPAPSGLNVEGFCEDGRRFWAKVRIGRPADCWLWTASRYKAGYGQFTWASRYGRSKPVGAHRVAWELLHGPIPDGIQVCHTCDVRACVNPTHLYLGTQLDNMRDASERGRLNVPRVRHRALIAEIRRLYATGEWSHTMLAERFGKHKVQIGRWLKGEPKQKRIRRQPELHPEQQQKAS